MTLEPLEPATLTLPDSPPKRSPRTGNIIFAVSSLISILACCICALAGAAAAPAGFTALQNRRATQALINLAASDNLDDNRFATATIQASQFGELNWPRQHLDTFDVPGNYWLQGVQNNDFSKIDYAIEDGSYIWDARAYKNVFSRTNYPSPFVVNFYVSVEVEIDTEADGMQYGLVFRDTKEDYYTFTITDNHIFAVYVYKDGVWRALIEPIATSNLLQNSVNRLTVVGQGSHFDFYINNVHVADLEDDSIPAGETGLAIGLEQPNDKAVVKFDNFELRLPEPPEDFEIPQPVPSSTPTAAP